MKNKSEFGKGLCYCLGLFLAHESKYENVRNEKTISKMWVFMWFNGANDHLYELQVPDTLPKYLQKRLQRFKKKCLNWGHGFDEDYLLTEDDVIWAVNEAKELLRLIDNANGIKTIKGEWQ